MFFFQKGPEAAAQQADIDVNLSSYCCKEKAHEKIQPLLRRYSTAPETSHVGLVFVKLKDTSDVIASMHEKSRA